MPKVSNRCLRRVNHAISPAMSATLTAAPRKVSFEDNFPETERTQMELPEAMPLRPKSTLARPKPSLSLVELDQSVEADSEGLSTKAPLSMPVSPLPSPQITQDHCSSPFPQTSSPWGQFVDMAIPDEESHTSVPHHSYGAPCSCCSSCRRRHSNPYGDYRSRKEPEPLFLTRTSHPFRLTQRRTKEPTEQLCGALDRLQVD